MNECHKYIEEIYSNPKLLSILKTIKPIELQNDLRQEMAISLLNYDCSKLIKIKTEGKLLDFAISIMWKMGTLQKGYFYKTYKNNDISKAIEYLKTFEGEIIPDDYIETAEQILVDKKYKSANDAHESIIFQKYIEVQNLRIVAEYFGVPILHIFQVVNNVKSELKKSIKK